MKKVIFSMAAALLVSAGMFFTPAAIAEVLVFDGSGNARIGVSHAAPGAYSDEFLFRVATESQGWVSGTAMAGNYGFVLHGRTALAGLGGSDAGNVNLITAPVPEPASYGMLAAGLGMLAFTARRKKSHKLH
ncbi:MAG: FxDxF family PEP-CTERM protein [Burkholderiaceae bacterium]|nr:FxDxF family PEP-CTERM protein [Burkholderiaceae bacterium]